MSTKYAMLDMNDSDKNLFYDHMGHSKGMNEQRYQCPRALKELATIGKFCDTIDKGKIQLINNILFMHASISRCQIVNILL